MSQNDVVRFPGNLDPSAQEFRPTYPSPAQSFPFSPFLSPPPQPHFFPLPPPPPPLQPPSFIPPAYLPPSIPPPASTPTRALLLTAVPSDVSESLIRRDLEMFGDVRAVQMERVSEGIITVHFYDLRAAHAALDAVREQHMQHQNRLRVYYSSVFNIGPHGLDPLSAGPPPPPLAPGLIAGRPVWAQFCVPATNAFPDGQNQGTIVIFNLNPNVSALLLKDIFQNFGAVKELRETPMKRQQRFVEFYDVRDASRALSEMNNKEINGRTVMIEYSRPGGHSNKKFNNFYNHMSKHLQSQPQQPPPFPRRTSPKHNTRRRRSSPSSEESLEAGMRGLTLRGGSGSGSNNNCNVKDTRKFGRNHKGSSNGNGNANSGSSNGICSSPGSNTSSKKQLTTKLMKPWKGKQKNFDPRFLIKEEAIIVDAGSGSCKDTRTTVMIKNIPNKYSQKLLLNMLDNHCIHCNEQIIADTRDEENDDHDLPLPLSSYDFVYLPIDFNNKCNVGYGFVNMTSPEATLRLYKAFHHQHWEVFNSRKICEVTYARVQGLEALKEHFKNSKFACENDEYLPVVFSPPRDGRHLTAPLPIVFTNTTTSTTLDHHHQQSNDNVDCSDFTSFTMTTTSTISTTSTDNIHIHLNNSGSSILLEDINDDNDGDDDHIDGSSSTNSSSSNDGGVIMVGELQKEEGVDDDDDDDDDGCSDSSMGCSIAD